MGRRKGSPLLRDKGGEEERKGECDWEVKMDGAKIRT